MKIKARIDIIEVKEEPVLTTEVDVPSIESEVARISKHLNPKKKYKISVTPELPGMDPENCRCIFNDLTGSPYDEIVNAIKDTLPRDLFPSGIMGPMKDGKFIPVKARVTVGSLSEKTRRDNR